MKFTVLLVTLLSVTWAVKVPNAEEPKDKREAPVGYPSGGHSLHSYPAASFGHGDANAISIGAGYSVGGAKPSYSYGAPESGGLQLSSESLPSSGHATIQLAPITLHSSQGNIVSGDLSQLMSQLSHGLNTGALQLSPYQAGEHGEHGSQEVAIQQYSFGEPKLQQYSAPEQAVHSVPSYAAGTKGLGSYGSTGPVLFQPSDANSQHSYSFGAHGGHALSDNGGLTFGHGNPLAGFTIADSGHGQNFGGSGHSLGGSDISLSDSGHSLGSHGISIGGSGHSFGGSVKHLNGGYVLPGKASFKPSTFLGAHSDSSHGLSGLAGSHGISSFGPQQFSGGYSLSSSHPLSGGHALSGGHGGLSLGSSSHGHGQNFGSSLGGHSSGSTKFIAPSYIPPKMKGFASFDSVAAFSSNGHASPPRTTYGVPSSSYHGSSASHAASSQSPQYYVSSSKFPGFSDSSSSFKGASGHSPLSSFSSGPKYSFHSGPSARHGAGAPKDIQGSYSENVYNTIKYSEELKPRMH